MFNAFVVALREFAELLVIAEALRACLRHDARQHQTKLVHAGLAAGTLAGLALSLWLLEASGLPWTRGIAAVAVGVMGLLLATGMLSSVRTLQSRVQESLERWAERVPLPTAAAGIATFAAAREALEVSLFLQANAPAAGWAATMLGATLGAATAVALAAAFRVVTHRINLPLMFQLSTLVLALLSIQLLGRGIGDLLRVMTPAAMRGPVLDAATPFLPGGHHYLVVCAVLMLMPVIALGRRWWHASHRD